MEQTRTHDLGSGDPGAEAIRELAAWPTGDDPVVRSNFVTTVDGSAHGPDGRSGSINTDADHRLFDALRATCDVVVVGAGTVRAEGYRGVIIGDHLVALRRAEGRDGPPALVIISGSLDLPEVLTDDGCGPVVVVTTGDADVDAVGRVRGAGAEVVPCPAGEPARFTVEVLCRERGWNRVLCEGGPRVHGTLLAAGLIDEICLSVAPTVIAAGADTIAAGDLGRLDLELLRADVLDDTVFLRWRPATGRRRS